MCGADKVWITKLALNYKILGQIVTRMRQFIGQFDVKHIITSLITTITSVLKALTDIASYYLNAMMPIINILFIGITFERKGNRRGNKSQV
jgi:hypothetical protein